MATPYDADYIYKVHHPEINEALQSPVMNQCLTKLVSETPYYNSSADRDYQNIGLKSEDFEENLQCINPNMIYNPAETETTNVADRMPTLYNQYPESSHNETLFGGDNFNNLTLDSSMNQVCI